MLRTHPVRHPERGGVCAAKDLWWLRVLSLALLGPPLGRLNSRHQEAFLLPTEPAFIALDLGATSGRTMLGLLRDGRLHVREAHRFEHRPRIEGGSLRWDWPHIVASARDGLAAASEVAGGAPMVSISCDAWAQDFGLLDGAGRLLYPPVSYRDPRTQGLPEAFSEVLPPGALLRRVGSVASPITTLCQLYAMARDEPEVLSRASTLLPIADLLRYELGGEPVTDWTLASASQMRSLATGDWDRELLAMLGIPDHFLPGVVARGALASRVDGLPLMVTAGHDTAAASAILPPASEGTAFVMCGTWSMLGCATETPVVPKDAAERGLAILGLAMERWGLFRSITGLWILDECRRSWARQGLRLSARELTQAAQVAGPQPAIIDPNAPCFVAPDDMPAAIAAYCRETGQPPPETPGQTARVVLASLAVGYRRGLEELEAATGIRFRTLRIVGGGSANELLCQMAADVTGLPVLAGPVEATAVGNLMLQALAAGAIQDPRAVAELSIVLIQYTPREGPGM